MKNISIRFKIFIALSCLTFGSCAYRVDKTPVSEVSPVDAAAAKGSYGYAQINALVFTQNCLGCHSARQPTLNSYTEIKANIARIADTVLVQKTMPPKGMNSTNRAILQKWIADGAPEQVANPTPVTEPSTPTPPPVNDGRPILWSVFKTQVFEARCLSCHFTGNKDGISDYTDINVVRSTIATAMYLTLVTKQMPPLPATLSAAESDAFARWIIDGMKDDSGVSAPPPPNN